jgi:hypothetical protein
MTAFEGWTSPAGQIGNDAFPPEPDFCAWVPGHLWRPPIAEVTASREMLADLLVLVPPGAIPPKTLGQCQQN